MASSGMRLLALALAAGCGVDAPALFRVDPRTVDLIVGDTRTFSIENGAAGVTWTSSAEAVATVDASGTVTAVGPGTAQVIAAAGGQSSIATVNVVEGARVGPGGGAVALAGGAVTLEVPAGAVAAESAFGASAIGRLGGDPRVAESDGYRIVLPPLAAPIGLLMTIDRAKIPEGAPAGWLRAGVYEDPLYEEVPGSAEEGERVRAAISASGVYAVRLAQDPPACGGAAARQFDFWLGQWTVQMAGGGTTTSRITRVAGGCIIEEEYASFGGFGRSVSFHDDATGRWYQTYVASGAMSPAVRLVGGLEGNLMRMLNPDGEPRLRATWEPLAGGRVRQTLENSGDGGKTWMPGFDGLYVPR
jgi:hypothetical protein